MTRRSWRELEREIEERMPDEEPVDDEPPVWWMRDVPQDLWSDRVAAWRYFIEEGVENE